jgi:hypothetical protein
MRRSAASWAWRSAALPLVLALALLAAGCSGGDKGGAQAKAGEAQAQPTTTTAPAAAAPAPAPVVASADRGDLPGLTLAVNQLRRSDPNTVTLIFSIANKGDKPFSFDWTWGEFGFVEAGDALSFDMSGVYLVDPEGKKKYLVLRDKNKGCICTTGILKAGEALKGLDVGQQTTMFAKFPAPPPSVTKVTVSVPHFPALDGVPLGS